MMINCSTNQFVPKRDLTHSIHVRTFAKHSKYDKKNVIKGNQRNTSIHSNFSNHIHSIPISQDIVTLLEHLNSYSKNNLLKEFKSLCLQESITRDRRPPSITHIIPLHLFQELSITSQLEPLNS